MSSAHSPIPSFTNPDITVTSGPTSILSAKLHGGRHSQSGSPSYLSYLKVYLVSSRCSVMGVSTRESSPFKGSAEWSGARAGAARACGTNSVDCPLSGSDFIL